MGIIQSAMDSMRSGRPRLCNNLSHADSSRYAMEPGAGCNGDSLSICQVCTSQLHSGREDKPGIRNTSTIGSRTLSGLCALACLRYRTPSAQVHPKISNILGVFFSNLGDVLWRRETAKRSVSYPRPLPRAPRPCVRHSGAVSSAAVRLTMDLCTPKWHCLLVISPEFREASSAAGRRSTSSADSSSR
ncbi:hypothetical protein OE88DRAFT_147815 [Heliocybe sulcata]|uniref:Uncharacterized protein n=1 Tax=Heliocybe sulcata TaxID=5364 RepID=A0A5C3NUW8_9AGAM|nr:hypothetical protein OE88DRAFT_147815 [Heliocybe sulcata]